MTVGAPPPPPPAQASNETEAQMFAQNMQDVFFDYDSYDIEPQYQQVLQADARFLQQHPNIKFTIEGHCDERGSTEYNLALGDNRANATKQALVSVGHFRRPHPHHQLRQGKAVLHREHRVVLAAEPPRRTLCISNSRGVDSSGQGRCSRRPPSCQTTLLAE